jgi:iron complex outermembrane receptor protein
VTPRVGLVYQPLPDVVSIFSSFSMSFDPPPGGPRLTPDPLKPETGQAWEIGTKVNVVKNLTAQATWFYITKHNYTVDTTTNSPPFFVTTQVGQLTANGVELSLIGQVTERLSTSTNYTIIDTVLRDDTNPDINDKHAQGVPANAASVWSRYNWIQDTDTKRTFGTALGVVYVDTRRAAFTGDLRLPAYMRWDAGVYYNKGRFNSAVYLENLFDKGYYAGSVNQFQVTPGAPFNVRAQMGVTF